MISSSPKTKGHLLVKVHWENYNWLDWFWIWTCDPMRTVTESVDSVRLSIETQRVWCIKLLTYQEQG